MNHKGPNEYRIVGDVAYLALTNRRDEVIAEAIVDRADLDAVRGVCRWNQSKPGAAQTAYVFGEKVNQMLHRWIMQPSDDAILVDHINGNGLDCRRANLRLVTHPQNMQNRRGPVAGSRSGVRNVHWSEQHQMWRAQVRVLGKNHHLGMFKSLDDASVAATQGRLRLMSHATR